MSDLLWVGIGTVFNSEVPFCVCALFRVKHGTHRMHLYFLLTETQVFVLMATYTHMSIQQYCELTLCKNHLYTQVCYYRRPYSYHMQLCLKITVDRISLKGYVPLK